MKLLYLPLLLLCAVSLLNAGPTYPAWWLSEGVVASQPPPALGEPGYNQATYDAWMADNYAVANLGQAKNLARAAYNTMDAAESGSAGTVIHDMVTAFSEDAEVNNGALNLGQLKAISAPFYDRMHDEGFSVALADGTIIASGGYPWNPATPVSENYALANLGQLKHAFSFNLTNWRPPIGDVDGDGLPDDWEGVIITGGLTDQNGDNVVDIFDVQPDDDFDNDGLSNLEEFLVGTDPTVPGISLDYEEDFEGYSSGILPSLQDWSTTGSPSLEIIGSGGANGTDQCFQVTGSGADAALIQEYAGKTRGIWFGCNLKAADVSNLPEIHINDEVQLRFGTSGIEVYNGYERVPEGGIEGRWVPLAGSDPTNWQQIIVHVDFTKARWEVFLEGALIAGDLGFNGDNHGYLAKLSLLFDGSDNFQIDEVRMVRNDGGFIYSDKDGDGLLLVTDVNDLVGEDWDGDGKLDGDEDANGNGVLDSGEDTDSDGILDINEYIASWPFTYDSDFDGLSDHLDPVPDDWDETGNYVSALSLDISFNDYALGLLDGQQFWMADTGVEITSGDSPVGVQAMVLDDASATLNLATFGLETLYFNMHARLQGRNLPSIIQGTELVYHFELDQNGYVNVWNGTAWLQGATVDLSNEWHVYSVGIDFQARTWSLWLDGEELFAQVPFLDPGVRSLERLELEHYTDTTTVGLTAFDYLSIDYWPLEWDRDSDGMPDFWEQIHFGDIANRGGDDFDHDGLTNLAEYSAVSDPTNADEDMDGFPDGVTAPQGVTFTTSLPFTEDFEVSPLGGNWNLEGNALYVTVVGSRPGGQGSNMLELDAPTGVGALTHYFDLVDVQSVWIDYYIIPVFSSTAPDSPSEVNQSAIAYIEDGADGRLYYYYGGEGWRPLDAPLVAVDDWVRITIHQDYQNQTWSLYQNGMRVMNRRTLSHAAPDFYAWAMDVISSDPIYLDDLYIGETKPADLDDDADGLTNEEEVLGEDGIADNGDETDPDNWDTDGDFIGDGEEIAQGSDPLDPTSLDDYVMLPAQYDFNEYSTGGLGSVDGWEAGNADVVVDPTDSRNQYVSLGDGVTSAYMAHPLAPSTLSSEVYISFRAKLLPANLGLYNIAGLDSAQANFLIALNSNGELVAYDPNASVWAVSDSTTVFDSVWQTYRIGVNTFTGKWSLSVGDETIFENLSLRDSSMPYLPYVGLYFQGLDAGEIILIDNLSVAHEPNTIVFDSAPPLPVVEAFAGFNDTDSLIAVDDDWLLEGVGASATVQASGSSYDGDSRILALVAGASESALLGLPVSSEDRFVTVSFALNAVRLSVVPDMVEGVLTDFYFDDAGALHLSDAEYWRILDGEAFDESTWYLFRFVYDFESQTYRLDVDGRTVATDLAFHAPSPQYKAFSVPHHSMTPMLLDAISVRSGAPPLITFEGLSKYSSAIAQTHLLANDDTGLDLSVSFSDPDNEGIEDPSFEVAFYYGAGVLLDSITRDYDGTVKRPFTTPAAGTIAVYAVVTDTDGYATVSERRDYVISADSDSDGLPDAWESQYLGNLNASSGGSTDSDLDGTDDDDELLAGSDPSDYYNFGHPTLEQYPVLSIVSGDAQSGTLGTPLSESIVIRVTDTDGVPLENAPLYFDAQAATALLGLLTDVSDGVDPISLVTNASGDAVIYAKP
ncbi:thrombospondin type 3 repeat-containing protein [Cerasicoccus arenae]|uniref:Uncharacterized protein n=1 Tax=Cerasicoccus arenae TaxID=424488 RepID=A0A8J3DCW8_9BACT|nr:thrombospondin type 3 repeat-containing protein [Cerasicoccus arenae]MBK1859894.1 hypothetical protein [Cerasicoccus arenae]GHC07154.1 hypothetical protein GCM10007047_25200 [Cerasicoccus arenae]